MAYIYALQLEKDKIYVGKSNNPDVRLSQHVAGAGAAWTTQYKPLEILFIKSSTTPFDEDITVKQLMCKYGIHNVRGGTYCTNILPDNDLQTLLKELRSANNLCLYCGHADHFVNDCPKNKKTKKSKKLNCKRCGRNTHTAEQCYATTKFDGKPIKMITCGLCRKTGHNKSHCPNQIRIG